MQAVWHNYPCQRNTQKRKTKMQITIQISKDEINSLRKMVENDSDSSDKAQLKHLLYIIAEQVGVCDDSGNPLDEEEG